MGSSTPVSRTLLQMSWDELSEDEVLERIRGILKGMSVLPLKFEEYELRRPPPSVSVTSCQLYNTA